MLNSLNNNPGSGGLDGLKAKLGAQAEGQVTEEPIIEEVYEDEPDDYNYKPQLNEVDEEELKALSAYRAAERVDRRVYMATAAFIIAAIIGAVIGLVAATVSARNADVQRKSNIARTIQNTMKTKLQGFEEFRSDFARAADGRYSEAVFNSNVRNYGARNFMLDISSEVTSEAVLLAKDPRSNPLAGLRNYSAKTMLLTQLLSVHVNETIAESDAILELQNKGDEAKVVYAMQILPDAVYALANAQRGQYANGVIGIYTYKDVVTDDNEASRTYTDLKTDNKWTEAQRNLRDYVATGKEKKLIDEKQLDLPNRLIYRVFNRTGRETMLFADELILIDRKVLFGDSKNALERYQQRNAEINKLIGEIQKSAATINDDLGKFIVEK
ncbi:MAG: hypothetical protein II767_12170 [Proteobacteria bacterium]|nr:hypothetical protein [Pseudomonadota bacterium]